MRPLTNEEITNPLARPEQFLIDHHINMLNQIPSIWNETKPHFHFLFDDDFKLEEVNSILQLALIISIMSHDFGKLAPAFQIKIKGVTLPRKERKLSFHIETSAIFARELFLRASQILNPNIPNEKNKILATIVYYVVLMHHQKVLQNSPKRGFDSEDIHRIQDQFRQIFNTYTLDGIKKFYQKLFEQITYSIDDYLTLEDISEVLTYIEKNIDDESFFQDIIDDAYNVFFLMGAENINRDSALELFFLVEYCYSVLCDLDEWDAKFYLENKERLRITFDEERNEYPKELVESYRILKEPEWKNTIKEMTDARNITFELTNNIVFEELIGKIKTLTAPTGSAKTLALLNLGFKLRATITNASGIKPKIIYCLPFITITEQVAQIVKDIMGLARTKNQTEELTVHHHLAPIIWNILENPDDEQLQKKKIERDLFFTKLWRSDVIITTFVRFWESILSCKKAEVLRFHRMANSIIIFDEIQAIPTQFWDIIYQALRNLATNYHCTIISATATQPLIIPPEKKEDLVDTHPKAIELYAKLNRYDLIYHRNQLDINQFVQKVVNKELIKQPIENLMIVLNTKSVASYVSDELFSIITEKNLPYKVYFLSRNVLASDRKNILERLQKHLKQKNAEKKCLLICTQLVEAGVDISFEKVIRDIAPLSSIIQVAGRCNRGMTQENKGQIHIFNLTEARESSTYAFSQIYDQIEIRKTRELLAKKERYIEEDIFMWDEVQLRELGKKYYQEIARAKDTKKCIDYLSNLQFFTLNEDFQLIKEIPEETLFIIRNNEAEEILQRIKEQQKKRKKVKKIPRKFYEYSLNISKKDRLKISNKIEPYPDNEEVIFWILRDEGIYSAEWGLKIKE